MIKFIRGLLGYEQVEKDYWKIPTRKQHAFKRLYEKSTKNFYHSRKFWIAVNKYLSTDEELHAVIINEVLYIRSGTAEKWGTGYRWVKRNGKT